MPRRGSPPTGRCAPRWEARLVMTALQHCKEAARPWQWCVPVIAGRPQADAATSPFSPRLLRHFVLRNNEVRGSRLKGQGAPLPPVRDLGTFLGCSRAAATTRTLPRGSTALYLSLLGEHRHTGGVIASLVNSSPPFEKNWCCVPVNPSAGARLRPSWPQTPSERVPDTAPAAGHNALQVLGVPAHGLGEALRHAVGGLVT